VIESLLIANRGEIARRIIRTAHRLGVRTIAAHSEIDAGLPFVAEADEAVDIGPAQAYRNAEAILAAARKTNAAAIHPGYGFLSENAEFARSPAPSRTRASSGSARRPTRSRRWATRSTRGT
jgi:acetyl-CoA carboxylase biotin carboxylase subunit